MNWTTADPVASIDAQIEVLRAALEAFRADLIDAEQLAVRAATVGCRCDQVEADARRRADRARAGARDMAMEIDELQAERRALGALPRQRQP